jgi:hypothetical protein
MASKEEIVEPHVDRFWHQLYIETQADPTDTRTDAKFCEDICLDYATFSNWKRKYRPFIFREVEARRRTYVNEMRSRIYKALNKKLDTDTNAIKLLAQLMGDLVEKTEVKTENMNDGDKVRRIKALTDANSKKIKQWEQAESKDSAPVKEDGPKPSESGGAKPEGAN